MKLSLPWYLTNYSEGLHTYYYILSKCSTQVSVNLIDGLSINRGKETTVCLDLSFRFIQIFSNFEVKYLPLPESYNANLNFPL